MAALLSLNLFANNDSLKDSLLQAVTAPVAGNNFNTTTVVINRDGSVVRTVIQPKTGKVQSHYAIDQISPAEVEAIKDQILAAQSQEIKDMTNNGVHCQAISPFQTIYSANGGSVFLKRERLCKDPVIRLGNDAAKLVTVLKMFENEGGQISNVGGITEMVCRTEPPMADAGYNLRVQKVYSDTIGYLGEESFVGEKEVARYLVNETNREGKIQIKDLRTKGATFTMQVDRVRPIAPNTSRYAATMRGKTEQGEVSEYLSCEFVK